MARRKGKRDQERTKLDDQVNLIGGACSPTTKAKGKLNENIIFYVRRMYHFRTRDRRFVLDTIVYSQPSGYLDPASGRIFLGNAHGIFHCRRR